MGIEAYFLPYEVFIDFHFLCMPVETLGMHIRVSNHMDPDQDRHYVGPDLDQNCLQRLSAD